MDDLPREKAKEEREQRERWSRRAIPFSSSCSTRGWLKAPATFERERERVHSLARARVAGIDRAFSPVNSGRGACPCALFTHKYNFVGSRRWISISLSLPFFFFRRPGGRPDAARSACYDEGILVDRPKFICVRKTQNTKHMYVVRTYVRIARELRAARRELLTRPNTWLNSPPATVVALLFSGGRVARYLRSRRSSLKIEDRGITIEYRTHCQSRDKSANMANGDTQ